MHRTYRAFAGELEKLAKLTTELLPHQQRVVQRMSADDQPGLVVVHGLGSGKTLTSIATHDALGGRAAVVVPAALQANYRKERAQHGAHAPVRLTTLQNAAGKQTVPAAPLLIVDEAHRARDPNSKTHKALAQASSDKRLLLTGSPFYNHPADIAPLINLAAGTPVLPQQREDFAGKYITERVVEPGFLDRLRGIKPGTVAELNKANAPELRKAFEKWVDYYPGAAEGFPTVTREDVRVPMTPEQLKVYDTIIGKAPAWVAAKVRAGLPPSKSEAQQLNAFLTAARQVANTTGGYQSTEEHHAPKIDEAFKRLKATLDADPKARAVVYSNYLTSGIEPYKQRLQAAGIPFGEFTGEMPQARRAELVNDYNQGKLRTLLLSSAGGEGLDLKGTRLMQLLEPHWNQEKLRQVEGRGARYKSHLDLPEADRTLKIERYLATRPRAGLLEKLHVTEPGGAVDEYLAGLSQDKEKLIGQFRDLLPKPVSAKTPKK